MPSFAGIVSWETLLDHQHNNQLSIRAEWASEKDRASAGQLGLGLHEEPFLLIELEPQQVLPVGLFLGADAQAKVFAGEEPSFALFIHDLTMLAEELELVVAENALQFMTEIGQFLWSGSRMFHVCRKDKSAPDDVLLRLSTSGGRCGKPGAKQKG